MEKLYRQGDVLFKLVKSIPKGTQVKRATGHIIEGEATGHIHRVADLEAAEVLEVGEGLFLSVSEGGDTLTLPAGNYEVVRQREYSPEEIRNYHVVL